MEITSVRIREMNENSKMKALVSIIFDKEFIVNDIKIIEGSKGMFIAFPSKPTNEGYKDICHPINEESRKKIQDAILEEYQDFKIASRL